MKHEETANTLYIPVNIKTRFEFFSGFGFSELFITAIATAIGIVIAVFIQSTTQDAYKSILMVLIIATATGMAVRKSEINQSVIDLVILYIRFIHSQQKYSYKYISKYSYKGEYQ